MAYEHKPGSFSLFKNDKGDNDKRPDYRGNGKDMAGREIEVAAWLRDGKDGGARWLSCTFKLKEARASEHRTPPQPPADDLGAPRSSQERQAAEGAIRGMPDDIPF